MTSAVLFYGYNLGAIGDGDWLIDGYENTSDEPEWVAEAECNSNDYPLAMKRHLLIASGIPEEDVPPIDCIELDGMLAKRCGIRIILCGHSNTRFYGLALEGSVQVADDWTPVQVATESNGNEHKLAEALEALSIRLAQENPSWILSPDEY